MLSKITLYLLVLTASVFLLTPALALEPLDENRARVSELHGTLLLPDYSNLNFDMSFDCGSSWNNTAMIITNKAGAQLLAASYTHLWGESAGKMVMHTWNNKVNPDDPRLPTFLIVKPSTDADFNWKKSLNVVKIKKSINSNISQSEDIIPDLFATCGTRSHNTD